MKWFIKFFNFYINSSVHVSLAVVALQVVSALCLDIMIDENVLLFTFFATITGYNFIKYSGLAKWHHLSLTESLKTIQIFSFLSFIGMLFFVGKLALNVVLFCAVLGAVTGLYALPVFSRKRNLRALPGIKIYTIALVWATVAVVLPVLQIGVAMEWDAYVLWVQLFLFVMVLMLPFDIRDLRYDAPTLYTIPMAIGVKKAKVIGVLFLVILVLLEALKDKITVQTIVSVLVISIISGVLLLKAKEKQSRYYASFWVEALPIVWAVLLKVQCFF